MLIKIQVIDDENQIINEKVYTRTEWMQVITDNVMGLSHDGIIAKVETD